MNAVFRPFGSLHRNLIHLLLFRLAHVRQATRLILDRLMRRPCWSLCCVDPLCHTSPLPRQMALLPHKVVHLGLLESKVLSAKQIHRVTFYRPPSMTDPNAVHCSAIGIDSHADTPQRFLGKGWDFTDPLNRGMLNYDSARQGGLDAQFFSTWVDPTQYPANPRPPRRVALQQNSPPLPRPTSASNSNSRSASKLQRTANRDFSRCLTPGGHSRVTPTRLIIVSSPNHPQPNETKGFIKCRLVSFVSL